MKYIEQLDAELKAKREEKIRQENMYQAAMDKLQSVLAPHKHVMHAVRGNGFCCDVFIIRQVSAEACLKVTRYRSARYEGQSEFSPAELEDIERIIVLLQKDVKPAA